MDISIKSSTIQNDSNFAFFFGEISGADEHHHLNSSVLSVGIQNRSPLCIYLSIYILHIIILSDSVLDDMDDIILY